MKRLIVSVFCAALLLAPAFAGDCCKGKSGETAAKPAACAKQNAQTEKASCCASGAQTQAKSEEKGSCCSGEQAKMSSKACQTCDSSNWMMSKPNPDCKACQTASL